MKAVILSAGRGTRLPEVSKNMPKVMVSINGKPLLQHHIENLKKQGIKDIYINLHYMPEIITDYFGDGKKFGVSITYSMEESLLGTGGALKPLAKFLDDEVIVIYGDVIAKVDFKKFLNFHKKNNALITAAIHESHHPEDSDLVEFDNNFQLKKIFKKPHRKIPNNPHNLAALYMLSPKAFSYFPKKTKFDIAQDLLPSILKKKDRAYAYHTNEVIMDIGTPERLKKASKNLNNLVSSPKMKVLITGGAGFIGSYTADELDRRGYKIVIYDNLSPKTHGGSWPKYLKPHYKKINAKVNDKKALAKALRGVDYVIHLAALMDLMPDYSEFFDTNVTSTAFIYETIVKEKLSIKKVIVASSQFVYGEGRWKCRKDGIVFPHMRSLSDLDNKKWDPVCPKCSGKITPLENLESHQDPPNQYAISKYTQELIALKLGRLNNIPSVAMRYSIVHGPRQSIKNAYSGALRIFTLQLLSGKEPTIFEDGKSLRDYVSVYDAARANALVLENDKANYESFNVGSGKSYTVIDLAKIITKTMGKKTKLKANGKYRLGDIRHAVSSIDKLKKLGWKVEMSEEEAVKDYINWIKKEKIDKSFLDKAQKDLIDAGIVRG